jgi:hypothetical protein
MSESSLRVRASNDLLFVKAVLNDSREGYVLLDTGAFHSAISEGAACDLGAPKALTGPVSLQGGAGAVQGRMLASDVRFRLGSRVVEASLVVIVGLDQLERYLFVARTESAA